MTAAATPAADAPTPAAFAHASEAELARILDFYGVRWRYEPDTYPIGWNLDGDVVESFSPDFHLPDLELYLELTTLKQKLVRKKNRKLRRLRELYPDIRIKLFYARDFRMLMLKFGRMALIENLTGTLGQSTPPRLQAPTAPGEAVSGLPAVARMPVSEPDGELDHPVAMVTGVDAPSGSGPGLRSGGSRRRGRRRRRASEAVGVPVALAAVESGEDPA